MSKFLLTVCAFGLLSSSALAQEKTLEQLDKESNRIWAAEGLRKEEATRVVASGTKQLIGGFTALIPDCGDTDSSAAPSALKHGAYIPLDHRTFLQLTSRWGRTQHESGSASFGINRGKFPLSKRHHRWRIRWHIPLRSGCELVGTSNAMGFDAPLQSPAWARRPCGDRLHSWITGPRPLIPAASPLSETSSRAFHSAGPRQNCECGARRSRG